MLYCFGMPPAGVYQDGVVKKQAGRKDTAARIFEVSCWAGYCVQLGLTRIIQYTMQLSIDLEIKMCRQNWELGL